MLTKLGTYLDRKRIWNPIDFQGQRSRSQGLIFRRGDTPRFALPLVNIITEMILNLKRLVDYDRLTDWIRLRARGLAIYSLTDS
jgi:hypothetical protein